MQRSAHRNERTHAHTWRCCDERTGLKMKSENRVSFSYLLQLFFLLLPFQMKNNNNNKTCCHHTLSKMNSKMRFAVYWALESHIKSRVDILTRFQIVRRVSSFRSESSILRFLISFILYFCCCASFHLVHFVRCVVSFVVLAACMPCSAYTHVYYTLYIKYKLFFHYGSSFGTSLTSLNYNNNNPFFRCTAYIELRPIN